MTIAVIGGAGYIGAHCVRALVEQEKRVIVIDNLTRGHKKSLPDQVPFYQGELENSAFLKTTFEKEGVKSIIHFAASSIVPESVKNPLAYYRNNLYGTMVLLEVMRDLAIKHIVFSSTAAVYGEPAHVPITEDMATQPTSPYGETKLAMEKMIDWASKAHGMSYVSLRYFNVAGAHESGEIGEDHSPETHLIPLVLEVPLGKRPHIAIYGEDYPTPDGTCIRDYIHVEDLISAHLKALTYLEEGGASDIFNLGSGQGFSVLEIIKAARKVTGHKLPALREERRPGDPAILIASSEKAKEKLAWHRKHESIEAIISSAWRWHQNNPEGFEQQ